MENFRKLGLIDPILRAIKEEKFEKPSEVQDKAIPLILEGKDVIVSSATGSGKTLAFASVIIKNSVLGQGIQALILTPTRELAEQVTKALRVFSKHKPLKMIAIYGGVSINPQIDDLARADVVVGTPGRILDHLQRRTIRLDKVKVLVLDEADRMLDMGFIDDVQQIVSQCGKIRQTMMFSATIPSDLVRLAQRYMNHPIKISAETYVDPKKLSQVYYDVPDNLKLSLLIHLLKHEHAGLIMVFCNSQNTTDFVARNLTMSGVNALAIHGGFSQAKRNSTMESFHSKEVAVLVCTDVAARGLDIKGVTHVYNYDIPKDSKQYIHRIGRTARAGAEGKAVNLLTGPDHDNFSRVIRDNDLAIPKLEMPYVQREAIKWRSKPEERGRFGHRDQGRGHSGPRRSFRSH